MPSAALRETDTLFTECQFRKRVVVDVDVDAGARLADIG
jgi:hypothetical protein